MNRHQLGWYMKDGVATRLDTLTRDELLQVVAHLLAERKTLLKRMAHERDILTGEKS